MGRAASCWRVQSTQLLVYRTGLARGEDGDNHLAWQVEVGNGADVREFVYVDAHSGKVVDQVTGIFDGLNRRAYDGGLLASRSLRTIPPRLSGWRDKYRFLREIPKPTT